MPFKTKIAPAHPGPAHGARRPPRHKANRVPSRAALWAGVAAVIVVAAIAATVFGGGDEEVATNSSGGVGTQAVTVRSGGVPDVGGQAPGFSVRTIEGSTFDFPTGKPTAIFFTSASCGSCIPKAQAFARIQQQVGDRVAVLGVDIDPSDTVGAFRQWIAAAGNPPFAFAQDEDSRLVKAYRVQALSTVVITDATGRVVFRSFSEGDEATLRDALAKAGLA